MMLLKCSPVAGVKNVQGWDGDGTPGRGIHEMGTARMGAKIQKHLFLINTTRFGMHQNVFVTDGAFHGKFKLL